MPVWGVCLGAQLLAASLGADGGAGADAGGGRARDASEPPPRRPIRSSRSSPRSSVPCSGTATPSRCRPGAVQLARSDAYEQQAFVVDGAYGIQFHIEVGADLADEWAAVPAYAASLEAIMGAGALPRLVRELVEHEQQMTTLARALFGAWLDRVVGGASLRSASVGPGAARPDGHRVSQTAESGRRPTNCGRTDRGSRLDDGFPTESGDPRPVTQRSRRRRAHARRTRRGHRRTARSGRS